MRGYRCRCFGSGSSRRSGLPDRLQVPAGIRRLRWLLFSEGHSQPCVHMRVLESARSCRLLAASYQYERVPEVKVLGQG
jgi:hypothetical protein